MILPSRAHQAGYEPSPGRLKPIQTIGIVPVAARIDSARGVAMDDDHVRVVADDLASEIGIALRVSFAGMPLDCEV